MRVGLAGVGRIGAFHAQTLQGLEDVDEVLVTDVRPDAAARLAASSGLHHLPDVATMLDSDLDALVIATGTLGHAPVLRQAVAAGVPTFCEKPVAATLEETIELADLVAVEEVPVQVGFQRRFDVGYRRARDVVATGELGFIHTVRANTHDQSPPPAGYIATSGGIFRDCTIHDFDIVRFVLGVEVTSVYATGANKGAAYFAEAGDVDTGAAVLTMEDGTVVLASATRYNGAGHDVRLEVLGEKGAIGVGLDDSLALRSAEPGVDFPRGPQKWSFMERFLPAYRAELAEFTRVVAGSAPSPCTVADALQAFRIAEACELSRAEHRPVSLSEIKGAVT